MIYLFMTKLGMGNQMFQYAFARKLQLKYDMDIICDLSRFKQKNTIKFCKKGDYALGAFKLTDRLSYKNAAIAKIYQKIVRSLLPYKEAEKEKRFKKRVRLGVFAPDDWFGYSPYDSCSLKNLYVSNGKVQAHRYFDEILPVLREDFAFKEAPKPEIGELLKTIGGGQQESVCLHWRRGDYKALKDSLLVCTDDYYDRAVRKIMEKVKNPVFYVFTNSAEDAEWIKENHHFDVPVNYINLMLKDEHTDMDDFRLMCACKHFIISNSTFSWWAQYLSPDESKVVVAPNIWHHTMDASELYLDSWEIVPV